MVTCLWAKGMDTVLQVTVSEADISEGTQTVQEGVQKKGIEVPFVSSSGDRTQGLMHDRQYSIIKLHP